MSTSCRQVMSVVSKESIMARYYPGKYTGPDERRAQEKKDMGMLPSDRGIAGMPQGEVYKEWYGSPALTPINAPEGLDDTREGIDKQVMEDNKEKKSPTEEPF